ncbi:protein kinase [Sulfurisphaera ohwakuensis]|uniref:Protein kinase n=2 Tax=Sulfurisphaera ohwakuensis TaxID=69656 RepID=A0A650CF92_SULOH|nr:protein kinase [Sulfurisphaera ohwakuensis]
MQMKIINKKLFYSSIANLFLILIFSIGFHKELLGLISIPFSILSSTNRKYLKIALVLAFLSSILEFPAIEYPVVLLLSFVVLFNFFVGTLIVSITDLVFLLTFLGYEIVRVPLNSFLLIPLATTSAYIGFLCIRALKGLDYNVITFKVQGLPSGTTWYLTFNNGTYPVSGEYTEIIADKGTWIICPIKVGNQYYVPDRYVGESVGGDIINIKFSKVTSIDPIKYPECIITFVGRNIPTDIVLRVDGKKYSGKEVTIFPSTVSVNWIAEDIVIGDLLFEPKVKSGMASRGQRVEIEFEPRLMRKKSQFDVYNWDPMNWIGENVYGYKISEIIGEGGGSYVLKGEKDNKFYAIKVLKVQPAKSQTVALRDFIDLFKESNSLIELSNHEGLVKLFGIFIDINQIGSIMRGDGETYLRYPPSIVMEFMEGGTVKDLLKFYYTDKKWYDLVRIILLRVSLALSHIHKSGYVHLDIKPQNIFFSEKLPNNISDILSFLSMKPQIVKLGDLGSTTKIGGKIMQITPEYSSPKQIENAILGLGATTDMDIFSFGILAYHLLTGGKVSPTAKLIDEAIELYNNNRLKDSLLKIDEAKKVLENWNIDLPSDVPSPLEEIVKGCIKGKINSMEEVIKKLT